MTRNQFFNAHHSPIGAFSSFTLGFPGAGGGLDLELGRSPKKNVYIGVESKDQAGRFEALPFFHYSDEDESKRYDIENPDPNPDKPKIIFPFNQENVERKFQLGTDTWAAGDLSFTIYSQAVSVPEPKSAQSDELKLAIVPAVIAELTIDNTEGQRPRRAFFGYEGSDVYSSMRRLDDTMAGAKGVGQGRLTAITSLDPDVKSALQFSLENILTNEIEANWTFGLGPIGAMIMDVPAGEKKTYQFAISFYRNGLVTAGLDASYYYTNYFKDIEEVSFFTLTHFEEIKRRALQSNELLNAAHLSEDQTFMMAHAIRSYYGSTQLLDVDGEPFWNVNEGEYRMMNTFDLTVDQLFFELKMNPWTVKNELDMFVKRFSYQDTVRFPNDATEYPGGISFTHDMGVANTISRPGYSSYEMYGLDGCFSHMTHEQLVNWVLTATVYAEQTGDQDWVRANLDIFTQCLESLVNRDHPVPEKRNGIMGLDSSRVMGGAEITTYDSLDVSLGQARNNIYLAGKSWASYVALEKLFADFGYKEESKLAGEQADKCAATIASFVTPEGYIPAVVGEGNDSKIIPAIEGLLFPYFTNTKEALDPEGRFASYIQVLKQHLKTVLVEGVCLFEDGGWKISSTSNNSWLSKIYLCQFIARQILGLSWDESGARADAAHVKWLTHPTLSIWSWSDQIISGEITGSKYYPRGVTSILWLEEHPENFPLNSQATKTSTY
ncbi:glycoside hydrolase family 52 protein [Pullulanibacillus sp. KACC 23026]|uniref:glycoside hydrolase family 52 protein n=1 Tax=Pullulanibacillus sp. KACC 23026 TaxID=3028315 RepID=UPI0023B19EEF|nr:glycoside hydrolase family 52 protein [Pullulanibacillus sp. KACC 23026]WEG11309.1 glycoside hydrolase family 52 protein [Pullulanibacillus sp. KACC 23026]